MQDGTVDKEAVILISKNSFSEICIKPESGMRFLRSLCTIKKDAIITAFKENGYFYEPSCFTIQTEINKHISLFPFLLKYTNHSCDPNVFFDTTSMLLIAIKDIAAGDELCSFYPSTEKNMAQSFFCNCGSKNCLGEITGASTIPKDILKKYRLTDFIRSQIFDI